MTSQTSGERTGGAPNDGTTLTEVLDGYAEAGFDGTFTACEQAAIQCNTCDVTSPAAAFEMSSLRRLEGASDPDDMMSVVAITCPACARQGVLILGFGPSATAEDSDITKALRDFRHDHVVTGNSAPGEAAGDTSGAPGGPGHTMSE